MNVFIKVLLIVSVTLWGGMGLTVSAFAGDVIKPTLKGRGDKYRATGEPSVEDSQAVEPADVAPRRGPHDDQKDRFGRRLDPVKTPEDRFGRQGGRYDGQDKRLDRGLQPYGQVERRNQPRFGRYESVPHRSLQKNERHLNSHFRSHYRHSTHYRQAYRGSTSGRFRHFNNSVYQSEAASSKNNNRSLRPLPYQYR